MEQCFIGMAIIGSNSRKPYLPQPWLYIKEEPQKTTAHRERMAKALDEILKETSGDIMIVSHAGAVGALAEEMSERTTALFITLQRGRSAPKRDLRCLQ